MTTNKWKKLEKLGPDYFALSLDKATTKCLTRSNFLHICFNETDDKLIAIDTKGVGYSLEYFSTGWSVFRIGIIGQSTFLAYSPIAKSEILVGQSTTDVKILKFTDDSLTQFCLLKGHKVPPTWVSFYKNYSLTASRKEAVIWDLTTGDKIHQLRLESNESSLRKALVSCTGLIAALYENDTIQVWKIEDLKIDTRLPLDDHGLRNAKDFIFAEKGRCLIACGGKRKILMFDTKSWTLSMNIDLPTGSSLPKRLGIFPQTLDTSFTKILLILFDDGKLKLLDLSTSKFIPILDKVFDGVRKFFVSTQGQWIATVQFDGSITINGVNHLLKQQHEVVSTKSPGKLSRVKSHGADEHLQCIRQEVKEELRRERLLPILEEFKEYPERHRPRIWKSLLNLPENRKACLEISEKISDIKMEILRDFKLADKSKGTLLSSTVDRLVCICPLLGQTYFIPELIFPFLIVFKNDPLAAFEISIMILMNFCRKWFEYHPLPPINVLGIIENILMEVDPELLQFYCEIEVTSTEYAWPLLRTTLSEVLTADEWLVLWDHIFSYGKPSFLLLSVVAYGICLRKIIMKSLTSRDDVEEFFRTPGLVGVRDVIKLAKKLDQNLTRKNHPSRYLSDKLEFLPETGPCPPFLLKEFPKFLVSDQEKLSQLQELKAEESFLRKKKLEAVKIAEEKRLRDEAERFTKDIHNQRLNELQKCYNEQLKLTKMSLESERDELDKLSSLDNTRKSSELSSKSRDKVVKNKLVNNSCEELRKNVDKLEEEVQSLLGSLRTSRK